MLRIAHFSIGACLLAAVASADSVVLGKGISNAYAADLACPADQICLDSVYLWEFEAKRTVAGEPVVGRVKALFTQHVDATPKFVRSVELFVVRPIDDAAVRQAYGASYYLVGLSPRYEGSTYCLPVRPDEIGLVMSPSDVSVDPDSGYYCFARARVR